MSQIEMRVDAHELSDLYAAAKAAPGMIQVELRRGIKLAAEPVRRGVASAAGFSSRIPAATKTKASFAARGASVQVFVDSKRAPHAAPINNKGRGGRFRHPVWADGSKPRGQWTWSDQQAVPFFLTGVKAGTAAADEQMLRVADDIAHKLGFH